MHTYRLRWSDPEDIDTVIGLRRYAEQWLAAAGIRQWTSSTKGDQQIRNHFEHSRSFIVEDEHDEAVASFALGTGDRDFWTPAELATPASYLYKFILGPAARGTGLGDVLLDWACYQAELVGGLYLRLDCHRTNTGLHEYYMHRGFYPVANRSAVGRDSGALFERIAETRLAVPARVTLVDMTDLEEHVFATPPHSAAV